MRGGSPTVVVGDVVVVAVPALRVHAAIVAPNSATASKRPINPCFIPLSTVNHRRGQRVR